MHPLSRQAAGRRLLATCQAAEPLRAGAAGEWRPGARGVSAPRRAHQQGVWRWACGQTPAAAGGWPGSMVREHGTGWVHAAGGKGRVKFPRNPNLRLGTLLPWMGAPWAACVAKRPPPSVIGDSTPANEATWARVTV